MANIDGRPRPDFTARVMKSLAAESPVPAQRFMAVAQAFGVARPFRARVLLIPVAIAVVTIGVLILRASRVSFVTAPEAPRITGDAYIRGPIGVPPLPLDRSLPEPQASRTSRVTRQAARALATEAAFDEPAIYTIAPLEAPDGIVIKSIEPDLLTVPALPAPVPLKVTDLPATSGGSRDQNPKEKS